MAINPAGSGEFGGHVLDGSESWDIAQPEARLIWDQKAGGLGTSKNFLEVGKFLASARRIVFGNKGAAAKRPSISDGESSGLKTQGDG